jgi:hypothetical protein
MRFHALYKCNTLVGFILLVFPFKGLHNGLTVLPNAIVFNIFLKHKGKFMY